MISPTDITPLFPATTRVFSALLAIRTGRLPILLTATHQREKIAAERRAVDNYLAQNENRVYGFNTYLGQHDDKDATDLYQDELHEAHLVGRPYKLDLETLQAMTIAKLHQSMAGGSGISSQAYKLVMDSFDSGFGNRIGGWLDYYGAGDVVPGCWYINVILDGKKPSETLRPGDLLALMSGSFVSTGFAIESLRRLIDNTSHALAALTDHCHPPHHASHYTGELTDAYIEHAAVPRLPVDIQESVVIRDATPFIDAAHYGIATLAQAIESRLSRPSANPWFHTQAGVCHGHYSQSSFMDLTLSSALNTAADTVRFLATGIKATMNNPEPSEVQIRIPKVAEVLIDELSAQPSARFAVHESDGLEDIADRSLARAHHLRTMLTTADQLNDLYVDYHGEINTEAADDFRDVLYSRLRAL